MIHRDTVILHDSAVHSGRRLDLLSNDAVLGQKSIKPAIELVIQAQGVVGVGTGIAEGFIFLGVHLIKMSAIRYGGEAGHLRTKQAGSKRLQAAVMEVAELPL